MGRKRSLTALGAVIIFSLVSFAQTNAVKFRKGFAIVDGSPKSELSALEDYTEIYCPSSCEIDTPSGIVWISFGGFGKFGQMKQLSALYDQVRDAGKMSGSGASAGGGAPVPEATGTPTDVAAQEDPNAATPVPGPEVPADPNIKIDESQTIEKNQLAFYQVPYPGDKTIFLNGSGGKIFILPEKSCPDDCSLKVSLSGRVLQEKKFMKGQIPVSSIFSAQGGEGVIDWVFKSGSGETKGSFEIQNQTPENMKKALSEGRNVEVLQ